MRKFFSGRLALVRVCHNGGSCLFDVALFYQTCFSQRVETSVN